MKNILLITTFFVFCFLHNPLKAQLIDSKNRVKEDIANSIKKINPLLGNNSMMEFKEELIISFFDKGIKFREDRVFPDALDPHNVRYSEEEKAVIIQCLEFKGLKGKWTEKYGEGCIAREFLKDNQVLFYSRIAFKVENKQAAAKLQEELVKLIRYGHELTFR